MELTEVEFDNETGLYDYNRIVGTFTCSQSELAEVLAEALRYEIEFNNNLNPKWVFEYEGLEIDNFTGFEIK